MEIIFVSEEFRDVVDCPFCMGTSTDYKKTIEKPCNCVRKKSDEWYVYYCNDCKRLYAVKK